MKQFFYCLFSIIFFSLFNKCFAQQANNYIGFETVTQLYNYFKPGTHIGIPLVQGHRGTKESEFPEGTILNFEFVLKNLRASIEIDPRLTKDSVIVVFHDESLNKNTNGSGKVSDYTWAELQQFNLKNPKGELTSFKIQLLEDIVDWARNKTVLILDRKDVPPKMIAELIKKKRARNFIINTVWSLDEAMAYFKEDSGRMFLISIRSSTPIQSYINAGISSKQLIGSLGTKWDLAAEQHCKELKDLGISSLLAAASTYDKLETDQDKKEAFLMLKEKGVDIIESDYPVRLFKILTNSKIN